jgi:SseB protein N-terminal domain
VPIGDFLPRTGEQRAPRELPPASAFAGDDGTCPPLLAAALALPSGPDRIAAAVRALAEVRVLVPVVAHEETEHDADVRERLTGRRERTGAEVSGDDSGGDAHTHDDPAAGHHGDRHASAALVTVRTPDGREALPVFSSVTALAAWRRDARPVPHQGPRTAMAAVDEAGGVLVLDAGSADPVVVPRPAVWALARGEAWVPALADPIVVAEVHDVVAAVDGVRRVAVVAGTRAEVKIELAVVAGLTREQIQVVAGQAAQALGESVVVAERVDSLELALTTA